MARHQNNLKRSDGMANTFARAALSSTGPAGRSPASYTTIDPETVAEEIFGASIDLHDREAVLDLLESVLPLDADGTVSDSIVQRALFTATLRRSTTSSGPFAPFYLTAQTLAANGALLGEIRPLSDSSGTNRCDYKTLIPLIHGAVSQLVSEAGAPDGPNGATVEDLLLHLTGYEAPATSVDVYTVGGYLGELRNRCGIDITNRCSRRDEGIVASFSSYVALAGAVVRAWDEVQATGGSEYLAVAESNVLRELSGISAALQQLREAVDNDDAWLTTVLPTDSPMVAGTLYQWISRYVSIEAPQLLTAGEDGFRAIALTMQSIASHVSKGLLAQAPGDPGVFRPRLARPVKECPEPGLDLQPEDFELPDNPCAGIPFAFSGDEVKGIVQSMLCHIQRVLSIAGSVVGSTTVVKHGYVVDGENRRIDWAPQTETVWVRACGNALESVPVYVKGEDGTICDAQYHSSFEGGVKLTLNLAKAALGRNRLYAGGRHLTDVVVVSGGSRPHPEPGQPIKTPDAPATRKSSNAPKSKA